MIKHCLSDRSSQTATVSKKMGDARRWEMQLPIMYKPGKQKNYLCEILPCLAKWLTLNGETSRHSSFIPNNLWYRYIYVHIVKGIHWHLTGVLKFSMIWIKLWFSSSINKYDVASLMDPPTTSCNHKCGLNPTLLKVFLNWCCVLIAKYGIHNIFTNGFFTMHHI